MISQYFLISLYCVTFVETYCWNVCKCKYESSQSYESRTWQTDYSNVHKA